MITSKKNITVMIEGTQDITSLDIICKLAEKQIEKDVKSEQAVCYHAESVMETTKAIQEHINK